MSGQVAGSVNATVSGAFKEHFSAVLVPAYEKASAAMFEQMHGMGGGRTHSGNSLGGLADLQQGLPLTDLPRSRSGEGLLAQPMLNANDPRVKNDPLYTQRGDRKSVV